MLGLVLLVAIGIDAIRRESRASTTDALTGLGNRRALDRAIGADERGRWRCGGVIALDLDHFKDVNDRFGHEAGDEVLRAVARALRGAIGDRRITRFGGEEFIVLLEEERCDRIDQLATRALDVIRELQFEGALAGYRASACVGYARREGDASIEEAMRRADQAVYRGKENGRGKVVSADAPRALQGSGVAA
nr:GGDEF domain-containing protein [Sphingomicrobium nitratireducens]